ncbi:hypothetical protein CLOP_g270 [Closterium sp. NIES-67]|nr:hypothetical protein CLOP_g270 [Closterium sp. NIES-67]
MAEPMAEADWRALLEAACADERRGGEQEAARRQLQALVRGEQVALSDVVGGMGDFLTAPDHALRARGTAVLASLVDAMVVAPLPPLTLSTLAQFFSHRMLALRLLLALLECHIAASPPGKAGAAAGVEGGAGWAGLAGGVVATVDGEKDPRCLLLALRIVALLVAALHREGGRAAVSGVAEDLFDVVAAYFPVSFNPPPNDPRGITREDLVQALLGAFSSTPEFAPMALPLLLDKLASSFPTAKLDSLRFLAACASSWGPHPIAPHASAIWQALKSSLPTLHPPAPHTTSSPSPLGSDSKVSSAALQCLLACVRATQPCSADSMGGVPARPSLLDVLLKDDAVRSVGGLIPWGGQQATQGIGERGEESGKERGEVGNGGDAYGVGASGGDMAGVSGRVKGTADLLASVARVSPSASAAVSASLLPPLMRLLLPPPAQGPRGGASGAGGREGERREGRGRVGSEGGAESSGELRGGDGGEGMEWREEGSRGSSGEGEDGEVCRAVQRELVHPRGMMALDVIVSLIRAARDVAQQDWERGRGVMRPGMVGWGARADVTVVAERERLVLLFRSALALAVPQGSHSGEGGQQSNTGPSEHRSSGRHEEAAELGVAGLECLLSFPPPVSPVSPSLLSQLAACLTHALIHLPAPHARHATTAPPSTAHATAPHQPSKPGTTPLHPPAPPQVPPPAHLCSRQSPSPRPPSPPSPAPSGGLAGGGSGWQEGGVSVSEVVLPLLSVLGDKLVIGRHSAEAQPPGQQAEERGGGEAEKGGGAAGGGRVRVGVWAEALAGVAGELAAARDLALPALTGLALRGCAAQPIPSCRQEAIITVLHVVSTRLLPMCDGARPSDSKFLRDHAAALVRVFASPPRRPAPLNLLLPSFLHPSSPCCRSPTGSSMCISHCCHPPLLPCRPALPPLLPRLLPSPPHHHLLLLLLRAPFIHTPHTRSSPLPPPVRTQEALNRLAAALVVGLRPSLLCADPTHASHSAAQGRGEQQAGEQGKNEEDGKAADLDPVCLLQGLLRHLSLLATSPPALVSAESAEAASVAVASLVNKWPKDSGKVPGSTTVVMSVDEVLQVVLGGALGGEAGGEAGGGGGGEGGGGVEGGGEVTIEGWEGEEGVRRLRLVAWVGRAAAMRGHESMARVAHALLHAAMGAGAQGKEVGRGLDREDGGGATEGGSEAAVSAVGVAAAEGFGVIMGEGGDCLTPACHCVCRPLYKQRFLSAFLPALSSTLRHMPPAPPSHARAQCLRAFTHTVAHAPPAALLLSAPQVLPLLLSALSSLSHDRIDSSRLHALLLLLGSFATTPGTARDLCGQHLTSITTNLLALAAYPHAMEVRETAVECVTALAGLPHTQVFPHTKKVLRAMDARLDDPKRAVRRAAVMCKTTWCVA